MYHWRFPAIIKSAMTIILLISGVYVRLEDFDSAAWK
jgi:hypothetical protein